MLDRQANTTPGECIPVHWYYRFYTNWQQKQGEESQFHVGMSTLVQGSWDGASGMQTTSLISSECSASEKQGEANDTSEGLACLISSECSASEKQGEANDTSEGLACLIPRRPNSPQVQGMKRGLMSTDVAQHTTAERAAQEQEGKPRGHACRRDVGGFFVCDTDRCGRPFKRLSDLRRHHDSLHGRQGYFKCRASSLCKRAMSGFPRKDKRDEHERKMHKLNLAVGL